MTRFWLLLLVSFGAVAGFAKAVAQPQFGERGIASSQGARSDYIEHCGGCHGINGTSAPARVPVLKDRVGYFMCLPEAREYLVRLPNVAHARIDDPGDLAALLNFMVFELGGRSASSAALPFGADEVARLRKQPLQNRSLIAERSRLVEELIKRCGAPSALRTPF